MYVFYKESVTDFEFITSITMLFIKFKQKTNLTFKINDTNIWIKQNNNNDVKTNFQSKHLQNKTLSYTKPNINFWLWETFDQYAIIISPFKTPSETNSINLTWVWDKTGLALLGMRRLHRHPEPARGVSLIRGHLWTALSFYTPEVLGYNIRSSPVATISRMICQGI